MALVATGVSLALSPAAAASTFNVDSTADEPDANTADPYCSTVAFSQGPCTLRAAIEQANAQPGGDTINVPAGTFTLNSPSQLDVTDDVIVDGDSASTTTIRPAINGRIFDVTDTGKLELRDATVRDGIVAAPGGGIRSMGTLVLIRCVVANNEANGTNGGGIFANGGPTTIVDSTIGSPDGVIPGNRAGTNGGGILQHTGTLTIRNSTVSGNIAQAGDGGGILTSDDPLVIERSVISGNTAQEDVSGEASANGGGIHAREGLTITDSIVMGNVARWPQGAGHGGGIHSTDTMTIMRSTIHGNAADGRLGRGGGIFLLSVEPDAPSTIVASTISANTTVSEGGGLFLSVDGLALTNSTLSGNRVTAESGQGGGLLVAAGAPYLDFMTIASNSAPIGSGIHMGSQHTEDVATLHATVVDNAPGANCAIGGIGSIGSGGFNVASDQTCDLMGSGDLQGLSAELGPLQANGGPTHTHAISETSPARDLVTSACPPLDADQRGVTRPFGRACDAGAFELVDQTAPAFLGAVTVGRRFAVSPEPTPVIGVAAQDVPRGTTIGYQLSEPARVKLAIQRLLRGVELRRRGRTRCVRLTARTRWLALRQIRRRLGDRAQGPAGRRRVRRALRRARCTVMRKRGSLVRQSAAGSRTVPFSGRIGSRALQRGRYRISATATDDVGNRSQPELSRRFRIVKARR